MSPRRPVPKRPARRSVEIPGDPTDPFGFHKAVTDWLEWLAAHNYSAVTVLDRSWYLAMFISWAELRGISRPRDVTLPVLEAYQRHVGLRRKSDGMPLAWSDPVQVPRAAPGVFRLVHPHPAHPLQPRLQARDAEAEPRAPKSHPHSRRGGAGLRRSRRDDTPRPARPGGPRSPLRHGHAPGRAGRSPPPRRRPHPQLADAAPDQDPVGPGGADGRTGRSVAAPLSGRGPAGAALRPGPGSRLPGRQRRAARPQMAQLPGAPLRPGG